MKRALAIVLAVCTLGVVGFGITLKGSWEAKLCFPGPTIETSIALTYTIAGFDITSTSVFDHAVGYKSQSFGLKGALGPFSLTGGMFFRPSPLPPVYGRSWLTAKFDFAGVALEGTVRHWMPGFWPAAWKDDPCLPQTPYRAGMQYIFKATVAPITITARFVDCCDGISFQDILVELKKIPLCCGIAFDAALSFDRLTGFKSLKITGIGIPICCGISLDVETVYTVTEKRIEIKPKFAGIAEACFTVWAAPRPVGYVLEGLRVDGFRIRCAIAECNYLEIVNVLNFDPLTTTVPRAIRDLFNRRGECREFEYIGLGFCGPGCCGGKYTVDLRFFFGEPPDSPRGLFGITRVTGAAKIPIMATFTLDLSISVPTVDACRDPAVPMFCIGWTFKF